MRRAKLRFKQIVLLIAVMAFTAGSALGDTVTWSLEPTDVLWPGTMVGSTATAPGTRVINGVVTPGLFVRQGSAVSFTPFAIPTVGGGAPTSWDTMVLGSDGRLHATVSTPQFGQAAVSWTTGGTVSSTSYGSDAIQRVYATAGGRIFGTSGGTGAWAPIDGIFQNLPLLTGDAFAAAYVNGGYLTAGIGVNGGFIAEDPLGTGAFTAVEYDAGSSFFAFDQTAQYVGGGNGGFGAYLNRTTGQWTNTTSPGDIWAMLLTTSGMLSIVNTGSGFDICLPGSTNCSGARTTLNLPYDPTGFIGLFYNPITHQAEIQWSGSINWSTIDLGDLGIQRSNVIGFDNGDPASVPEPASWLLFGSGVGLLGWARSRRRRNKPSS